MQKFLINYNILAKCTIKNFGWFSAPLNHSNVCVCVCVDKWLAGIRNIQHKKTETVHFNW